MVFKRKIYDKLLEWKNEVDGKKALLIEGARRIGNQQLLKNLPRMNIRVILLLILMM